LFFRLLDELGKNPSQEGQLRFIKKKTRSGRIQRQQEKRKGRGSRVLCKKPKEEEGGTTFYEKLSGGGWPREACSHQGTRQRKQGESVTGQDEG